MIKTKNLEDLLDKEQARKIFASYREELNLSSNFQIQTIHRHIALSPFTYALLCKVSDDYKIIKFRANASQEQSRQPAFKVMEFLREKFLGPKFFIPQVCFYDSDYNLLVYKNTEGTPFINQLRAGSLESEISLCGQWLKKLHLIRNFKSLTIPHHQIFFNFPALKKYYPKLADQGPLLVDKWQKKIVNKITPCLIHGDFQPNNIIIDSQKIIVFDYTDSEIADPVIDVVRFLVQMKVMLFRFASPYKYKDIESIFLKNYALPLNKNNFQIYAKITYLQILGTIAAAIPFEEEARGILSEVYKYFKDD